MTRFSNHVVLLVLFVLGGASLQAVHADATRAQPAQTASPAASEPLLRSTFGGGTDGWTTIGPNSKLTPTRETEKAALRWDYAVQKGDLSALVLPVAPGVLAKANLLRFSVKSATLTPLVVIMQEKNGGRYAAIFSAPADAWQTVELALGDFILADGKTDPKDRNGKLDLDQVESVGIADLTQFVLQSDNVALTSLFGVKAGDKHLFVADWAFYGGASALGATAKSGYDTAAGRIDAFAHPQIGWVALNVAGVKRVENGLVATYRQSDEHPLILTRAFPAGLLAGKTGVGLTLVSETSAKLVIQVETRTGNKWKATRDQVGQKKRKTWLIPLADFAPDDANAPINGKTEALDLAQVHQITLIDITGITDGAIDDTSLTISDLMGK